MGMPSVTITFQEKAKTAQTRMDRGIVGLVLRGAAPNANPVIVTTRDDIPDNLSRENREQIELALLGNEKSPRKVVAYMIPQDAENYQEALEYFELKRVNYLAVPTVSTDGASQEVKAWIKKEREEGNQVKAVLPECEADDEGVINFATAGIICGEKEYTVEQYCARIAGLIAATEAKASCTFAALPEVDMVDKLSRSEANKAVEAGKLILRHDGEKVKIVRGVNSLQTTTATKGDQFKKIKIVDIMDMIRGDITKTIEDVYIGKYPNTYDNKCLLVSAIADYLETLEREGLIEDRSVDIDAAAVKRYLVEKGEDVSVMTDDEIKKANTADKVFLAVSLKTVDVIEEVYIPITV
ncbi:phage tail sheath protein [Clostridiales bacterium]|nr:phage tail sheath protein [Clostridiales bacterium]